VKPPPFAYCRPGSVHAAVERLAADPGAVPLSGGQSLVPLLNLRLARPSTVVDLGGLHLDAIDSRSDAVVVGAGVTHAALEHYDWPSGFGGLTEGVGHIGYPAIRHRGTLGGSLAHADPSAELPCLVIAFDARIELTSPAGTRLVGCDDFFLGYYDTIRRQDEIVTAVTFPVPSDLQSGFAEISRRRGDFAIALAAVTTWQDATGRHARAVVGGLDVRPRRIPEVEEALVGGGAGEVIRPDVLEAHVAPSDDIHASADYRLHVGAEMLSRAVAKLEAA
jgi:aerobic carbon-monoxide dehydrogenase medium subunit